MKWRFSVVSVFFLAATIGGFLLSGLSFAKKDGVDSWFKNRVQSFERSPCSPTISGDFLGIKIASPSRVTLHEYQDEFGSRPWLPVCGIVRIDYTFIQSLKHDTLSEIELVVEDLKTKKIYRTHLIEPYRIEHESFLVPPEPKADSPTTSDKEKYNSYREGSCFNINLFYYLSDLPKKPASYRIYARLGHFRSNEIFVQVLSAQR